MNHMIWTSWVRLYSDFFPPMARMTVLHHAEPQIVVEGWIDAGGYTLVLLSQIVPVSEQEIGFTELKCVVVLKL